MSLLGMPNSANDTDEAGREVIVGLYRLMTPAEKIRRVSDLTLAASQLALAGLRDRHPKDSYSALLLRLARIRLGDALVAQAFGTRKE